MSKTALLIIDPQVDFHEGGSLGVPGATEDTRRLCEFLRQHKDSVDDIFVTLDSHQRLHVAHPLFWVNAAGEHPAPFTLITAEQVKNGEWKTTREEHREHGKMYTQSLEAGGRFTLCIWPYHCLIGTPGHSVHPDLSAAMHDWAEAKLKPINYVMKGTNPLTEHYSALRADVVIDSDPTTGLNTELVEKLKGFDRILICGQALSHCVNFTTRDLTEHWPADKLSQMVIISDGASPVPGFEEAGQTFVNDMRAKGLTITTFAEAL